MSLIYCVTCGVHATAKTEEYAKTLVKTHKLINPEHVIEITEAVKLEAL